MWCYFIYKERKEGGDIKLYITATNTKAKNKKCGVSYRKI